MKLVPNASDWHRWWSMRLMILGLMLEGANQAMGLMPSLPAEFRAYLPPWLPLCLFGLAAIARVVKQKD